MWKVIFYVLLILTIVAIMCCSGSEKTIYENEEYGFRIKFSEEWRGFKVFEKSVDFGYDITAPTFYIAMPTNDENWYEEIEKGFASIFVITAFTEEDLEVLREKDETFVEMEVGANNHYVFTSSHGQACPDDLEEMFFNNDYEIEVFDVI